MKANLQKLVLNPEGKDDSIQFRIDNAELCDIKEFRRDCRYQIILSGRQSTISFDAETGEVNGQELHFSGVTFVADTCSISICCLQEAQIATVTLTVERKESEKILDRDLLGKEVDLRIL
jgi:hypothetical protein